MKSNQVFFALLSALLSSGALAGTMGVETESEPCWGPAGSCWGTPRPEPFPLQRVNTLSLGPAWHSNSASQTFFLQPGIQKTYMPTNSSNILTSGEVFLGMQKQVNNIFFSQFGIALAAAGDAQFNGDIWEDANPSLNHSIYNYKVNHMHIGARGKLLADVGYSIRPYITASAGIGFNKATDFTITPLIYGAFPTFEFRSQTTTAFTYTLGAGVQEVLNKHWQAGIGYEFANWGESQLARAHEQTLNNGLRIANIHTNAVLLNLTYIM